MVQLISSLVRYDRCRMSLILVSVMAVKTKKPQEWGCASYFLLAEGIRLRVSFLYFTLFRLLALCEVMGGTPWRPSQVGRGEFVVTIGYQ